MRKYIVYTASILFFSSLFLACNPARRIPDGQYLLHKNNIEIEDAEIQRSELAKLYRQEPNRRILGFYRFHLNVYQFADRGKETRFRRWLKNTVGEPPVIYDPVLTENTLRQFEIYMHSKGYFNADIEYTEKLKRKKARITYHVEGNTPYTIQDVEYNIPDGFVREFVLADTVQSHIKRGDRYEVDNLNQERNRIARNLRDDGFFRFSRDFISFSIDSNLSNHQVKIEVLFANPVRPVPGTIDSVAEHRHKRFIIDQVVVLPEFSVLTAHMPRIDTTVYVATGRRGINNNDYHFYHNGPLVIRPSVIANHLMIRPGDYFRISDVERSYLFLSELRNFRFINLGFQETDSPSKGEPSDTLGYLVSTVQLNRSAANAFTVEAEGLNTAGNLGVASNVLFQNRNVFGGAEIFKLRLKVALEVTGESGDDVFQQFPFNTLELGGEVGLDFPKLLLPFPIERLSRNARPKSSILAGVNFRQRPDYTRYLLNLTYGFEWNETAQKRHFIYPVEISSVSVYNDSILRANITDANPFILSRFRDHFILGLKYTYLYNTQQLGRPVDFVYLRTNFESAGNFMNLMTNFINLPLDDNGSHRIFNIPFSQYLKGDADYRYYRVFDENQSLVFRLMGGLGIPYGNVEVLPFIKSYYGGGANGIRAWRIYTLGPGSAPEPDKSSFDRYGDIKLEANIEYRFKMYRFWHGAFFIDAGNVWLLRESEQFPGGEFRISQLGNDTAIGGGLGIRMDFDFFILRIDAATPVKDPSKRGREQWLSSWPSFSDFNFNLGIGYPF